MARCESTTRMFPRIKGHCAYCKKAKENNRRKYCCDRCSDMAVIESNPHSCYAQRVLHKYLNEYCPLCLETDWFSGPNGPRETHHIIPVEKGGDNKVENLVFLHHKCHVGPNGIHSAGRIVFINRKGE